MSYLVLMGKNNETISSFGMFKLMLLHLIILIMGLGIGVHFMGNKIIIALINYVIQIFILGFSIRRDT